MKVEFYDKNGNKVDHVLAEGHASKYGDCGTLVTPEPLGHLPTTECVVLRKDYYITINNMLGAQWQPYGRRDDIVVPLAAALVVSVVFNVLYGLGVV